MKFNHLSRVYLRDDEYYELMSPKNIASTNLLKLARQRGLLFSALDQGEDVRSQLALLPSDWATVSHIFEEMARPDPEERRTSVHLKNCDVSVDPAELIRTAEKARQKSRGESYTVTKVTNDITRIEVTYTEPNYSLAVPYQRRERKLIVDIVQDGEQISFRYTASSRAREIVDEMRAKIKYKEDKPPEVISVSLFAIRDAVTRTKFFTNLIKDIEGYRFDGAAHVDVESRFPQLEEEPEEDEEEQQREAKKRQAQASKVKALINHVALSGEQVLASDLYQQAIQSGYYIGGITWSCLSKADERHHLDFDVGFVDSVKADQFTFDVVRQWRYKPEKPDFKESVKMTDEEKRKYMSLLEAAALRAYQTLPAPAGDQPSTTG